MVALTRKCDISDIFLWTDPNKRHTIRYVTYKGSPDMALLDYIWLIRLIMEILKVIADMTEEERSAMAQLRLQTETKKA